MKVAEGQILSAIQDFLDDFNGPLYPLDDDIGPIAKLIDPEDNSLVTEAVAVPHPDKIGHWTVDVGVPEMQLLDVKRLVLKWTFKADDDCTYTAKDIVEVMPARQHRISDLVMVFDESDPELAFDIVLPFAFDADEGDVLVFKQYKNNAPIGRYNALDASVVKLGLYSNRCEFRVPYRDTLDKLEPVSVICSFTDHRTRKTRDYTYMLWAVTPQILTASRLVEDHIDKARLENVIPELEYTQADLVQYLFRGLALFNNIPPRITAFTGTNMQGTLLDNWVVCSCYYALAAQLQAEGAMAFDFSGQSVSLNMDRSPSIESALGRIEGLITDRIRQSKGLITKTGLVSGDGSAGGRFMDGSRAMGVLGVTQSPTTILGNNRNSALWFNARYGSR